MEITESPPQKHRHRCFFPLRNLRNVFWAQGHTSEESRMNALSAVKNWPLYTGNDEER